MQKVHLGAMRSESPSQLPDQLTLSRQATEMQSIKQFIAGLTAVRENKVSDLRARIESGDYDTAEPEIAEAMFRAARQERLGV